MVKRAWWYVAVACSACLFLHACATPESVTCPATSCQLGAKQGVWPPTLGQGAGDGANEVAGSSGVAAGAVAAASDPLAVRYQEAVRDVFTIEADEIFPLVTLRKDDPLVTYDAQGRVLLLTVHRVPDVFKDGSKDTLKMASWTFTDKEFASWLDYMLKTYTQDIENNAIDWPVRICQLLGMYSQVKRTHVSALWVDPQDVIRPAYSTDIYSPQMSASFADAGANHDAKYQAWFNDRIIASYFSDSVYPWTRLGYSYDLANPCSDYGLSEFLVRVGAPYEVAYTLSLDDFVTKVRQELLAKQQ